MLTFAIGPVRGELTDLGVVAELDEFAIACFFQIEAARRKVAVLEFKIAAWFEISNGTEGLVSSFEATFSTSLLYLYRSTG
jgi:hypothetical protein